MLHHLRDWLVLWQLAVQWQEDWHVFATKNAAETKLFKAVLKQALCRLQDDDTDADSHTEIHSGDNEVDAQRSPPGASTLASGSAPKPSGLSGRKRKRTAMIDLVDLDSGDDEDDEDEALLQAPPQLHNAPSSKCTHLEPDVGNSDDTDVSPQQHPRATSEHWTCAQCTLHNAPSAVCCVVCDADRVAPADANGVARAGRQRHRSPIQLD